jgi:hypothetical protein
MADSDLREFFAPMMAHCVFAALVSGLLIPPIAIGLARKIYPRLVTAMRTKAASQAKGSNLGQLATLMPLLLMTGAFLASWSFLFFLKWYHRARSVFVLSSIDPVCTSVYLIAGLASLATTFWWLGPQAFRPPGYDPKNPNPDPDEWRWKNKT